MHFALPPRKTSRPPPYAARNQTSIPIPPALRNLLRRDKLRTIVLGILAILTIIWLFGGLGGGGRSAASLIGTGAPVVIVTVIDPTADAVWIEKVKRNREEYAAKHGRSTPTYALSLPLRRIIPGAFKADLQWLQAISHSSLKPQTTLWASHHNRGPKSLLFVMP